MVRKKSIITACLLFSFAHGLYDMPLSHVKHEGITVPLPVNHTLSRIQNFVTNDYATNMRDVIFQNDLLDLMTLAETCKDRLDQLQELNIIVQSDNEYQCPRDQLVTIKILDNRLTVVIKDISEDLLLECIPINELLPEKKSQTLLGRYVNAATQWITKMGIYIWIKTLAKYAKCTVIINGDVRPEEEHVLCSDIIIDLFDLAEANKLHITRQPQDLLNTHITISKK